MDYSKTTFAYSHNMARVTSAAGGVAELAFDPDPERWPWLALPPQHPVVLEKYQYFGGLTAFWVLGLSDPRTHGALIEADFELPLGECAGGHATKGTVHVVEDAEGVRRFELRLENDAGEPLATYRGRGHNFDDRDYKSFRAAARQKTLDRYAPGPPFEPASCEQVGLTPDGVPLVSTLAMDGDEPVCQALVTAESGFHPGHPFHTGSGDHVNVGHMFDCALQLAHQLLQPDEPLRCVSGACAFMRFVELDVPFELRVVERAEPRDGVTNLTILFRQVDRDCARVTLGFARGG